LALTSSKKQARNFTVPGLMRFAVQTAFAYCAVNFDMIVTFIDGE